VSYLTHGRLNWLCLCLLLSVGAIAPALAQDPRTAAKEWEIRLGGALALRPDFPGASDLRLGPVPVIDITYDKRYFLNSANGLGALAFAEKLGELKYVVGGSLSPSFDTRNAADIPGLDKVGTTALARVFSRVFFGRWSFDIIAAQDILGEGHKGLWAETALAYSFKIRDRGLFRVGATLRMGSGDYFDALYSVSATESALSGLPAFDASAGLERAGAEVTLLYPIGPHWDVVSGASYNRQIAAAGDSPVTQDADQFRLLLGLAYRF